jgi:hypothetical protein
LNYLLFEDIKGEDGNTRAKNCGKLTRLIQKFDIFSLISKKRINMFSNRLLAKA